MPTLCRDCFAMENNAAQRCAACGSPRLVSHGELRHLSIAHLDCDAFYASVEKRDRPELRDKPLIIGGGQRGVVSTACYIARIQGVRSAMPMFKALKACPNAVVLPPDMAKYAAVSKQIRKLMEELTPLVEPLSIDEAFLDLTGTERLHHASPAESLARLANRIEQDVGVSASIGLAPNKFLAKIASDLDKPRGFAVIGAGEALDFLSRQKVSLIWGVGQALEKKLAQDGITHIHQLQTMEEGDLMKRYGSMGSRLYRLSRGQDSRRIVPRAEAKSISSETTFFEDISDPDTLKRHLWRLSEKVSARAKASDIAGSTIVLKLKDEKFRSLTRNRTLSRPTQLADTIYRTAEPLLDKEANGTRYRLIGVGISHLSPAEGADLPDLIDQEGTRRAAAERAIDKVRSKFGLEAIGKGRGLSPGSSSKKTPGSPKTKDKTE